MQFFHKKYIEAAICETIQEISTLEVRKVKFIAFYKTWFPYFMNFFIGHVFFYGQHFPRDAATNYQPNSQLFYF